MEQGRNAANGLARALAVVTIGAGLALLFLLASERLREAERREQEPPRITLALPPASEPEPAPQVDEAAVRERDRLRERLSELAAAQERLREQLRTLRAAEGAANERAGSLERTVASLRREVARLEEARTALAASVERLRAGAVSDAARARQRLAAGQTLKEQLARLAYRSSELELETRRAQQALRRAERLRGPEPELPESARAAADGAVATEPEADRAPDDAEASAAEAPPLERLEVEARKPVSLRPIERPHTPTPVFIRPGGSDDEDGRSRLITFPGTTTPWPATVEDGVEAYRRGDFEEARTIWRELAVAGVAKAQFHLGAMIFDGRTDRDDLISAYIWITRAARQGYRPALPLRDTVAEKMTRSEILSALRRIE